MITPIFDLTITELVMILSIVFGAIWWEFKIKTDIDNIKEDFEDSERNIMLKLKDLESRASHNEIQEGVLNTKLDNIQEQYKTISSRLDLLINKLVGDKNV